MTEQRPDTDDRREPGGTPTPANSLTGRPATPGDEETTPTPAPGAYAADDIDRERARAVKPGN
jgi:hypothetical protein